MSEVRFYKDYVEVKFAKEKKLTNKVQVIINNMKTYYGTKENIFLIKIEDASFVLGRLCLKAESTRSRLVVSSIILPRYMTRKSKRVRRRD